MKGSFNTNIWSHELEVFKNCFKEIETKIGKVFNKEFEFMEEPVKLNIITSKTGQIGMEVTVCPNPSENEYAMFTIELDQSYLPEIINSLEIALKRFPVQIRRF